MKICKLCTKTMPLPDYFNLSGPSFLSNDLSLKDLLEYCFPDIVHLPDNTIICRNCTSALHITYSFRKTVTNNIKLLSDQRIEFNREHKHVEDNLAFCDYQPDFENQLETDSTEYLKSSTVKLAEKTSRVCHVCGKCLSGSSALSTHMKIHTGTKSHLCELCGKHFRVSAMLKLHQRIHAEEKLFKCNNCDYCATRKAHLQSHMRTHTGVTILNKCQVCDKRYASKILLYKHLKLHKHSKDKEVKITQL